MVIDSVLIAGSGEDEPHRRRVAALAAVYRRLAAWTGSAPHERRRQELTDIRVDAAALDAIQAGTNSWGAAVDAKHRKAIRRTPGLLLSFPFDDGTGRIDTFITDWSPLPGAAAIAVHAGHAAAGTTANGFTGRFVRHPLTGDLLPVWVADWVRPDFGTGAVVVNPAHSAMDLDFARTAGLPVRFALAETTPGADPASWPTPPVVKSGLAVRAGNTDGLDHSVAAQRYRTELIDAGHAEPISLPSLPGLTLADHRDTVRELARGLLAAPNATVLTTPTALTGELLLTRAVLTDQGFAGQPDIVVVGKVGSAVDGPPDIVEHALVVAGAPQVVVAVKEQLIDQVLRLITTAAEWTGQGGPGECSPQGAAVSRALRDADFPAALTALTALRRTLKSTANPGDAQAYLLGCHILFGTPAPGLPNGKPLAGNDVEITGG